MQELGGAAGRAADRETRRRAHALVARRMSGDADALLDLFDDDVELRDNCARIRPFPDGRWRGREALREKLRRANIEYEPLEAEVRETLVEGDRTALRWTGRFRRRATGCVSCMDMAHFLRWRNGRVAQMDEFIDYHAGGRDEARLKSFADMLEPPAPCLSRDEMARRVTELGSFSREGPDIGLFRRYCAPEVINEFVGDRATIFYAGRHRGIDALARIIRAVNVDFEQVGAATPRMIVEGGGVAARRTVEWRHRGTGRRGIVELADFFRFENGLIVELVEFRDSVALLRMQD